MQVYSRNEGHQFPIDVVEYAQANQHQVCLLEGRIAFNLPCYQIVKLILQTHLENSKTQNLKEILDAKGTPKVSRVMVFQFLRSYYANNLFQPSLNPALILPEDDALSGVDLLSSISRIGKVYRIKPMNYKVKGREEYLYRLILWATAHGNNSFLINFKY